MDYSIIPAIPFGVALGQNILLMVLSLYWLLKEMVAFSIRPHILDKVSRIGTLKRDGDLFVTGNKDGSATHFNSRVEICGRK